MTDVFQVDGDARLTAENLRLANVTMPTGEVDDKTVSYWLGYGMNWRYFGLDADGNWDSTVGGMAGGVAIEQQNDAVGRLLAIDKQAMKADSRGNLQKLGADPLSLTHEDFSGLLLTASNGTVTYNYVYDSVDRRTSELGSDGTISVFLWDGDRLIAHGDPSNLTIDVPGEDIDEHVTSVDDTGTGPARFYHQGLDESVFAVSDANGLVEGYSYSAYGDRTVWGPNGAQLGASTINTRFGFQGQVFDPPTATYAMRARQYVPKWGRFTAPDPLSFTAGPSLYSFTGSRPVAFRDPLGLSMTSGHQPPPAPCGTNPVFGCTPTPDPGSNGGGSGGGDSSGDSGGSDPTRTTVGPPNGDGGLPPPPSPDPEPPHGARGFGPPGYGFGPVAGGGGGRTAGPPPVFSLPPNRVLAGPPIAVALPAAGEATAMCGPVCGVVVFVGTAAGAGYLIHVGVEKAKQWWTHYSKKDKKQETPKKAQRKVDREQGPRDVTRIDEPKQSVRGSQWHAHGENGGALNQDGSLHDGLDPEFSNKTLDWLRDHGWNIPRTK